jgi:slime mold repeat-containing protein
MRATTSGVRFARFFAAAGILVVLTRPESQAASFVKAVGTRARTSAVNSSITVNVPSSGVVGGDSVLVTLQAGDLAGPIGCSDNVNGAYAVDVVSAEGSPRIAILSRHNVAALSFGDVITCTYPLFSGSSSVGAYQFTGLEAVAPLDQIAQGESPASGPASTGLTGTTAQPDELVFGFFWLTSPAPTQTYTPASSGGNPLESPYSPQFSFPSAIGTQIPMYRFVNAFRQYEANGTVNGTGAWKAQVATYRLVPDLCTGVNCDDANECTADSCDPSTGACSHAPEPAGTHCGDPTSSICDRADRCDGAGACLPRHLDDGTVCGEPDGDCDNPDTCLAGACHDNGVQPAGVACGDAASGACDGSDTCDAFGFCEANNFPNGSACGDAGSECVNADACLDGICHDNGFRAVGEACGDSSDTACSHPDSCNGTGLCLANNEADGTSCGDAGSACVRQDTCSAGLCADNGFEPAGTACGDASSGACDSADTCSGEGLCLANHAADGTPCGDPSSSACDAPDGCDAAGLCASNRAPVGTACDDGVACTISDSCDASGLCAGVEDPQCSTCGGNTAPIVSPAVAANPAVPMALGSGNVTLVASFTDTPGQIRSCSIDWNDGSAPDSGVVLEPTDLSPGTCTGSHLFTAVGVYTVTLSISDGCDGATSSAVYRYVVVYDPSAGYVTGGGWINSPPGAYTPNPLLTGKASFGFVARYLKGNSKVPVGVTEFHFSVANFNFQSDAYEWLVISGAKARFKGTGTVNGTGNYTFELTAWDGEEQGGGNVDRFRISIADLARGNMVVYDNQVGAPGGADPTTTLGGGSIVIHNKK